VSVRISGGPDIHSEAKCLITNIGTTRVKVAQSTARSAAPFFPYDCNAFVTFRIGSDMGQSANV
jgi:hypothetical protein